MNTECSSNLRMEMRTSSIFAYNSFLYKHFFFSHTHTHRQVTDMATVLNTISVFENMNIPASQLAQTHLVTYLRKLRRRSTNKYLSNRLRILLRKWRDTLDITSKHKIVREC